MEKDRVAGRGRRKDVVGKRKAGKSMRPFYLGMAAIGVIGAALLGYVLTRPKASPVTLDANTPLPSAEGYFIGNPAAPVQVLEFADMQCPVCADFGLVTEPDVKKRLIDTGKIGYRFLDFPLQMHPNAWNAANAGACANEQGKFWEMKDQIFNGQLEWSHERNPQGKFEAYAKSIGLDEDKFEECYESKRNYPKIQANLKEGERRMVSATPSFIIGNKLYTGSLSYDRFKAIVDSAAAAAPQTPAASTPAATRADTARR